jgi:diguanylate cyclase (GGDEF)-like protein
MQRTTTGHAVLYTVAGTLAGASISFAATGVALGMAGMPFIPVAMLLSVGLPATLAPVLMYPLILMNHRQRKMRIELEHLVHTDMLTDLPNRRAFFEFARPLMGRNASSSEAPLTAMMIDVDHFKPINDTYGHDAGDRVLRRIAATIRDAVAETGAATWTVARLGGEEFAVLVDGLVPTAVARLAERICMDVRRTEHDEINGAPASVSVGVAFRGAGMGIDRLLKLADDAVYHAKNSGRDRWAFGGDRQVAHVLPRPVPEPANDRRAAG